MLHVSRNERLQNRLLVSSKVLSVSSRLFKAQVPFCVLSDQAPNKDDPPTIALPDEDANSTYYICTGCTTPSAVHYSARNSARISYACSRNTKSPMISATAFWTDSMRPSRATAAYMVFLRSWQQPGHWRTPLVSAGSNNACCWTQSRAPASRPCRPRPLRLWSPPSHGVCTILLHESQGS